MKSPMIESATYITDQDKLNYSDLQVMKSAAGYYVGTTYKDPITGFNEPGSRDSEYFPKQPDAWERLQLIEAGEMKTRMEP